MGLDLLLSFFLEALGLDLPNSVVSHSFIRGRTGSPLTGKLRYSAASSLLLKNILIWWLQGKIVFFFKTIFLCIYYYWFKQDCVVSRREKVPGNCACRVQSASEGLHVVEGGFR